MSNIQTAHLAADYMTVAMARAIHDGERVFHGVASPMPAVAIQLAKSLHARNAVYLNIPGGVDSAPSSYSNYTTCDSAYLESAASDFPLADIFDLSARGGLDLAFLGGAQIDGYGRLNLSAIGSFDNPKVRLPGGAGSAALLPTVKRGVLWRTVHDKRSFVEELDVVTASGNTDLVITPLGIFKKADNDGRLRLYSVFPHSSIEEIVEKTGFAVEKHVEYEDFSPITDEEAALLEKIDSNGLRYSEFR